LYIDDLYRMSKTEKSHTLTVFPNGQASLHDPEAGETMHSTIGPDVEARIIYIEQSRLAARLGEGNPEPLVLFDVGLGIAANSIAAVALWQSLSTPRSLTIHSFETKPEGLAMALGDPDRFPGLAPWKPLLSVLLAQGEARLEHPSGAILRWRLWAGDFRESVGKAEAPEVIFYDFYSPKANPALWSEETFRLLRQACEPRTARGLTSVLTTYCAATHARVAMLGAGFFVGWGERTPAKNETTLASTRLESLPEPLNQRWLSKLERSTRPVLGADRMSPEDLSALRLRVRRHPQFSA